MIIETLIWEDWFLTKAIRSFCLLDCELSRKTSKLSRTQAAGGPHHKSISSRSQWFAQFCFWGGQTLQCWGIHWSWQGKHLTPIFKSSSPICHWKLTITVKQVRTWRSWYFSFWNIFLSEKVLIHFIVFYFSKNCSFQIIFI